MKKRITLIIVLVLALTSFTVVMAAGDKVRGGTGNGKGTQLTLEQQCDNQPCQENLIEKQLREKSEPLQNGNEPETKGDVLQTQPEDAPSQIAEKTQRKGLNDETNGEPKQDSSEIKQQSPSENAQQEPSENAPEPKSDNNQQGPSEIAQQEPSEIMQQGEPQFQQQGPSDIAQQEPSDLAQQEPSENAPEPPSENAQQSPSEDAQQSPSENAQQGPSENPQYGPVEDAPKNGNDIKP